MYLLDVCMYVCIYVCMYICMRVRILYAYVLVITAIYLMQNIKNRWRDPISLLSNYLTLLSICKPLKR